MAHSYWWITIRPLTSHESRDLLEAQRQGKSFSVICKKKEAAKHTAAFWLVQGQHHSNCSMLVLKKRSCLDDNYTGSINRSNHFYQETVEKKYLNIL